MVLNWRDGYLRLPRLIRAYIRGDMTPSCALRGLLLTRLITWGYIVHDHIRGRLEANPNDADALEEEKVRSTIVDQGKRRDIPLENI